MSHFNYSGVLVGAEVPARKLRSMLYLVDYNVVNVWMRSKLNVFISSLSLSLSWYNGLYLVHKKIKLDMIASIEKQEIRKMNNIVMTIVL